MILLALASLASAGAAQSIDCSTFEVNSHALLRYKQVGPSPSTGKEVVVNLTTTPINLSACGYKIFSDGKMFKYTAPSQEALFKLVNFSSFQNGKTVRSELNFAFVGKSGFTDPYDLSSSYIETVWFNYNPVTGEVGTMDRFQTNYTSMKLLKDATAVYKVDGGPTKFFYYKGVINRDPIIGAKIVDFYVDRKGYEDGFDRLRIDNSTHTITIWQKHAFPTK